MVRLTLRIAAAVAGIFFLASAAVAAPSFPSLTGRVVDAAHVLDAATVQVVTARSQALEQSTGRQLVVATVPSLQGLDVQDYGYQLLRAWGVGSKKLNDGVVLVVAPAEKKVGIETGYGVEATLTDALSSVILQDKVLPKIEAGDLNGGVRDGADAIADQLALPDDQAQATNAQAAQTQDRPRHSRSGGAPGFLGVIILFFVLSSLFGRRRGGGGGGLGWLPWVALGAMGARGRDDDWGGGGFGGGFGDGGGGFSGGGGSGGGGGASGSW